VQRFHLLGAHQPMAIRSRFGSPTLTTKIGSCPQPGSLAATWVAPAPSRQVPGFQQGRFFSKLHPSSFETPFPSFFPPLPSRAICRQLNESDRFHNSEKFSPGGFLPLFVGLSSAIGLFAILNLQLAYCAPIAVATPQHQIKHPPPHPAFPYGAAHRNLWHR
jgi:hypothetical protein